MHGMVCGVPFGYTSIVQLPLVNDERGLATTAT
jgi:hypothetical protein